MKNKVLSLLALILPLLFLSSCASSSDKIESTSYIYGITTIVSLVMLLYYFFVKHIKKNPWYFVLFISVFVINVGYLLLSNSKSLEFALISNRVAYLGSAFLPMSMFLIILNDTNVRYKKSVPISLIGISFVMFLIAASPGYLNIYYKEVSFEIVNGVAYLKKVYGDWHILYMLYLLGYFSAMIASIVYAYRRKTIDSTTHSVLLLGAVFINIGVWLIEQFISTKVEILAISYIISELFLLGIQFVMEENKKLKALVAIQKAPLNTADTTSIIHPSPTLTVSDEQFDRYIKGVDELTVTERSIYRYYVEGKTTKEIMSTLNIKENTLKFHNKNIYSKLGISSRKQLVEIYRQRADIISAHTNGDAQ